MGKASRKSNYLRTFRSIESPEYSKSLDVYELEKICLAGVPLLKSVLPNTDSKHENLHLEASFSERIDSFDFYKKYKELCKEGLAKAKNLKTNEGKYLKTANFNNVLSQIYLNWSNSRGHRCLDSEFVFQRITNSLLPKSYDYMLLAAKLFERVGDIETAYKSYSLSADLAFKVLDGYNRENTHISHISKDKFEELAKKVIEPSKKAIELSTRVFDNLFAAEQFRVISNTYGLLAKVFTSDKEFAFEKYNTELSYFDFREEHNHMKRTDKKYTFQRIAFAAKNLTNYELTPKEEEEVFSNWQEYELKFRNLLNEGCEIGRIKSEMSKLEIERYSLKRKGQEMTSEMRDKYFSFLDMYKKLNEPAENETIYDQKARKQHKQALYKTCLGVIDTLVNEGLLIKNISFLEYL